MLPHRLKHAYGLRMGQSGSLFFFSSYHFLSHLLVDDTTIHGHLIKRLSLEQYLFSNNITPLAGNLSGPHWLQDVVKCIRLVHGGGHCTSRAPNTSGSCEASYPDPHLACPSNSLLPGLVGPLVEPVHILFPIYFHDGQRWLHHASGPPRTAANSLPISPTAVMHPAQKSHFTKDRQGDGGGFATACWIVP